MTVTSAGPARPAPPARSVSTTNACRMCMPLGACLAFTGIEGCVPLLHGSQGCATYIRRYLISHFAEPMDIASSSVGETATVFGGEANLRQGVANVTRVYRPQLIGVATTCLTETIGEDVGGMLARLTADREDPGQGTAPVLVHAPTPSYAGTHADGFQAAVTAAVAALAGTGGDGLAGHVNLFPGIVSTADLRHLRELMAAFGLEHALIPDWSDRLDGPSLARYAKLPAGGTPLAELAATSQAVASVTLGGLVSPGVTLAGDRLADRFGVAHHRLPFPIGLRLTDQFMDTLAELSGRPLPDGIAAERGRLVDAYIDGHKYAAEKVAVVYGDEDLVLGLSVWLAEIGVTPALVATGGRSGRLATDLARCAPELADRVTVMDDADFRLIGEAARDLGADLFVGHSKGYRLARELGLPLVRVGLPIHDRVGAQRVRHLGYEGTQALFDRVVNALIAHRQDHADIAYSYM
ncbi:MAG: hypothetical protein LBR33_05920 [Propionibacteriaceae bacterium]|jgi:nitrogenase molybdenum-iron protein NifN|nr:hypothetical protein [Propionibacteriaceae bacterium]